MKGKIDWVAIVEFLQRLLHRRFILLPPIVVFSRILYTKTNASNRNDQRFLSFFFLLLTTYRLSIRRLLNENDYEEAVER